MGYSRWDDNDYKSYARSTNFDTAKTVKEVFKSSKIHASLDPKNILLRESRDSELNPNSTPIIFGLDVTGSMGIYAQQIAQVHLPKIMETVISEQPVSDPHIMFMGIGDVWSDSAPLQVSQFEPDTKIIEQLRNIYIEGGGGGDGSESYDLAWHFAAYRTELDCVKSGRKGFCFTFGDEFPKSDVPTATDYSSVYGSKDILSSSSMPALVAEASKKYHVFHFVIEQTSTAQHRLVETRNRWSSLLGNNAIFVQNVNHLSEIILCLFKVMSGMNIHEAISSFDTNVRGILKHAFMNAINA